MTPVGLATEVISLAAVVGARLQEALDVVAVFPPVSAGVVAPVLVLLEVVDPGVGGGGAGQVAELAFLELVESVIPVEVVVTVRLPTARGVGEVVAAPLPVGCPVVAVAGVLLHGGVLLP
jgi:hypothetical protein